MMKRREILSTALVKNSDRIDDGIRSGKHGSERVFVGNIGIECRDLPDIAHRTQKACIARVTAAGANHRALGSKPLHHVAPDESGRADDRDSPWHHGSDLYNTD